MTKPEKYFGQALKRVEDPRFITGAGNYTDDIAVAGALHAAMVRSPYPHAKITAIHSDGIKDMAGVKGVLTGEDIKAAGIGSIPPG